MSIIIFFSFYRTYIRIDGLNIGAILFYIILLLYLCKGNGLWFQAFWGDDVLSGNTIILFQTRKLHGMSVNRIIKYKTAYGSRAKLFNMLILYNNNFDNKSHSLFGA